VHVCESVCVCTYVWMHVCVWVYVLVCVSVHLSVSVIRCNNKSPRLQEAGRGPSKKERKKEREDGFN